MESLSEESSSDEEEVGSIQSSGSLVTSDEDSNEKTIPSVEVVKKSGTRNLGLAAKPRAVSSWKGKEKTRSHAVKNLDGTESGSGSNETEQMEALPEGWNGQEVTLFRMLHPIFGHNYCSIAEIIRTKTCQKVM